MGGDHRSMHPLLRHAARSLALLRAMAQGPCPTCGIRSGSSLCELCRRASLIAAAAWPAHLDGLPLRFVGAYRDRSCIRSSLSPLGRALLAFKDRGDRYAGRCLVRLFAGHAAATLTGIDAIVPVPSDPQRLRRRGFSPAAWLAGGAARQCGVPLLGGTLSRVPGRPPQRGLGGAARRANARGTLALGGTDVRGYAIAIVDDVVTTGATLREAATCLTLAGARRVEGLVLACADEDLVQGCRSKTEHAGTTAIAAGRT